VRHASTIVLIFFLLAITAAELVFAFVSSYAGILLHVAVLFAIVTFASFTTNQPYDKIYLAVSLAPLLRIFNLSMPVGGISPIYWYGIVSIPILLSTFMVARRLELRWADVGLTVKKLPLQLAIIPTGLIFAATEYWILKPEPLIAELTLAHVLLPALILAVGTGFTEEVIFRGVMQRSAEESQISWGWFFIATLFAVLHIHHAAMADIVFVFLVGVFFYFAVKKTGSILGVSLSHALTNIMLYLVLPFTALA